MIRCICESCGAHDEYDHEGQECTNCEAKHLLPCFPGRTEEVDILEQVRSSLLLHYSQEQVDDLTDEDILAFIREACSMLAKMAVGLANTVHGVFTLHPGIVTLCSDRQILQERLRQAGLDHQVRTIPDHSRHCPNCGQQYDERITPACEQCGLEPLPSDFGC